MFEEGLLVFINGQITEARVGLRHGKSALNWLSTWGLCRCSFMLMSPPALPSPGAASMPPTPYARITQKLPAVQMDTDPRQPLPPRITQKLPALPANLDSQQPRITQKLTTIKLVKPTGGNQNGYAIPYNSHTPAAPISVTPYLTRPVDEAVRLVEERNLSRYHKHLLLLIDGRRTTLDLMRVMGRSPDEMSRLIGDLRYLGLVGLHV
jgi:hypothetical protein